MTSVGTARAPSLTATRTAAATATRAAGRSFHSHKSTLSATTTQGTRDNKKEAVSKPPTGRRRRRKVRDPGGRLPPPTRAPTPSRAPTSPTSGLSLGWQRAWRALLSLSTGTGWWSGRKAQRRPLRSNAVSTRCWGRSTRRATRASGSWYADPDAARARRHLRGGRPGQTTMTFPHGASRRCGRPGNHPHDYAWSGADARTVLKERTNALIHATRNSSPAAGPALHQP